MACKEAKCLPEDVWLRRRKENPVTTAYITMGCNHCADPACLKACPYRVPQISKTDKKAWKCDACAARLAKGEKPACVANCPMGAIEFGPIEELRAKYPAAVEVGMAWAKREFNLPSPNLTKPSLVIVPLS